MEVDNSSNGEGAAKNTPGLWPWVQKKPWVWAIAFVAGFAAFLTNSNAILTNLRTLPGEFGKTSDQFSRWWHDDAAWTGYWTNSPEGYVDAADMNLSNENMAIDLTVKNGKVEGTISTKPICGATPFNDFFLVRGDVSGGKSATIVVWDTFQGHNVDIAKLELKRDGVVMTVVPKEGTVRLFPKEARLAIDPSNTERGEFCKGKREAVTKALSEIAKDAPANRSKKRR